MITLNATLSPVVQGKATRQSVYKRRPFEDRGEPKWDTRSLVRFLVANQLRASYEKMRSVLYIFDGSHALCNGLSCSRG